MNYRRQWKDGRMDGSFAKRVCLWTGGTLVAVLVLGVALSTSVGAQNTDDLRVVLDRMERLERDIRTLNLSLSRGRPVTPPVSGAKLVPAVPKAGPRGATADWEGNPGLARMEVRLSALENDLRSATGSMEQFGFQIREIGKRLDKLVSDMDYRLSVLEGRTQGQPGAVSGARTAAPPRLSAAPAPPPRGGAGAAFCRRTPHRRRSGRRPSQRQRVANIRQAPRWGKHRRRRHRREHRVRVRAYNTY